MSCHVPSGREQEESLGLYFDTWSNYVFRQYRVNAAHKRRTARAARVFESSMRKYQEPSQNQEAQGTRLT